MGDGEEKGASETDCQSKKENKKITRVVNKRQVDGRKDWM